MSSPVETFCQHGHLPRHCGSVIRADSEMNKTYCYFSRTLSMAFLLKHVAPIKLWVVGIVYLALDFHISSFHILFSSPFLCLVLCMLSILYCLYLCKTYQWTFFSTESYNGLLPVLHLSQKQQLVSAKYVLYQLENASNKNSCGWECSFQAADVIDNSRLKAYWM